MEGGKEGLALLTQGRKVTPQTSACLAAQLAAKAARDLELYLEHAQIVLGLVVVEGNGQVVQEGQPLVLPQRQPLQPVASRGLLEPTALAWPALRRGIRR